MIEVIESVGSSTIRVAMIYILAATGSNIAEKSGILNLTIEGNMLISAFAAIVIALATGSAYIGLVGAVVVGMVFGAFYGLLVITGKSEQMIASLALNLFAAGLTTYLLRDFFGSAGASPKVTSIPQVVIPGLSNIPILGKTFFIQSPVVYIGIALVGLMYYMLKHTKFGLRVISVGENPMAAQTVGVNVRRVRYFAIIIAGALAGIAGGYLSVSLSSQFVKNMTAGRGFIALSTVIVGKHKPINIGFAGLLFGFFEALQIRLQLLDIPTQFIQSIPYLVTVFVIAFFVGKDDNPAAITQPF
jgi:simple sugar transport system permease protein